MSVHVEAFGPKGALRDIVDLSLKGDIDGLPFLSVKRYQFFWGKFFDHFQDSQFLNPLIPLHKR
jgi:hypothetical protein